MEHDHTIFCTHISLQQESKRIKEQAVLELGLFGFWLFDLWRKDCQWWVERGIRDQIGETDKEQWDLALILREQTNIVLQIHLVSCAIFQMTRIYSSTLILNSQCKILCHLYYLVIFYSIVKYLSRCCNWTVLTNILINILSFSKQFIILML